VVGRKWMTSLGHGIVSAPPFGQCSSEVKAAPHKDTRIARDVADPRLIHLEVHVHSIRRHWEFVRLILSSLEERHVYRPEISH